MYFTDRGIEELEKRRGDEEVTLAWLAERLQEFTDIAPGVRDRRRAVRDLAGPARRPRGLSLGPVGVEAGARPRSGSDPPSREPGAVAARKTADARAAASASASAVAAELARDDVLPRQRRCRRAGRAAPASWRRPRWRSSTRSRSVSNPRASRPGPPPGRRRGRRGRRREPRIARAELGLPLLAAHVEHLVLGREVAEEGARRDPGVGGDRLDRGLVVPVRGEPAQRRVLERPAGVVLALLAAPGRSSVTGHAPPASRCAGLGPRARARRCAAPPGRRSPVNANGGR